MPTRNFAYKDSILSVVYDIKFHTHDETSKDEKQHDAVDKSTSKQQVCILDGSLLCYAKNWTHIPSASGCYARSYSRQVGQQTKPCCFKRF